MPGPEVMPSGWGMARGKAQRARAEVEDTVATVAVDEDGVEELVLEVRTVGAMPLERHCAKVSK